jgi:hypothetical protein
MPLWRMLVVQGVLLLAAGVLFTLSWVLADPGDAVGVAGAACFAFASVDFFAARRSRRRMREDEERNRPRRGRA